MAHLSFRRRCPNDFPHLHDHIQIIAKHEQEFLQRRTRSEKLGDSLGIFIGSLGFVSIHVCWFTAWVSINVFSMGVSRFDPYPFSLLNTIVALEAVFLASFIVMRQSRMSRRSDERDHLILQILMLTEKEITAALGIERQIAARMGIEGVAKDAGIERLTQETSIDAVAQEVQQHLAEE
jgi:uncharacterized membrane protein